MKTYLSGGIAPRILGLGGWWRWVVSLTHRPIYLRYLLHRRWSGMEMVPKKKRLFLPNI